MNTPGTIYYTTDGTTPTYNSNRYQNPINIQNTTTLQYYATDLTGNTSTIYSNTYTIKQPPINPVTVNSNTTSGLYNCVQNVALSINVPGTIYYTTDGSIPTFNSARYTSPILINKNSIIKFFAMDLNGNISSLLTNVYTIDTTLPSVNANPLGGLFNANQNLELTISEPGTIYYTTDGTTPTSNSPVYVNSIPITSNKVVKYFALDLANNQSPIYTNTYTIDEVSPTIAKITPSNNGMNVPTNQVIKIIFSEPIKTGSMDIILKNSKGTPISITTNINGNILIINHKTLLSNGKYYLIMHTGSVTDLAGNPLAICSNSFTVDSTIPTVKTVTPTRNAVKVSNNQVIKIIFSEPIKTGNMQIVLKTDKGKEVKFTENINGNILTLKPTTKLNNGTKYSIVLHSGSVTDLANNNLTLYSSSFTTI